MRPIAFLLGISVVLPALLFSAPAPAQGEEGAMRVVSKLTITSLGRLEGSGSATIEFTGNEAKNLRQAVINAFDSNGDMVLEPSEVRQFLGEFCKGMNGRNYWGINIESETNFTAMTDPELLRCTSGLAHTTLASDVPVAFSVDFEGTGSGVDKVIDLAQGAYEAFALALAFALDHVDYEYNGTVQASIRLMTYGFGTLTSPKLRDGRISELRLPWGQVIWYSFSGHIGPTEPALDRLSYRAVSLADGQLIGFVILLVGSLIIMRTPGKRFDKYEKLHPRKFRKYAKPLVSVKLSAYGLVALAALLYLFPYAFALSNPNSFLSVAYLFVLVPAFVVVELVFSRYMYDRAAMEIPEEQVIEVKQAVVAPSEQEGEMLCKVCYRPIEAGLEMYRCACGVNMHMDCAVKEQVCPQCGAPLVETKTRSIQCRACGETFLYSGEEDAFSIQCTVCGAFQEEIKAGRNYLIVDDDPRNAYMMIRAVALSNRPAMCMTTSFPGKIRSDYDLTDVVVKWFSDSTTDIDNVNPKDLMGDAMETLSTFLATTKNAGVLIDGIETLIELNGFDKVLEFLVKANDLATLHGSTVILALNKKLIPGDQFKAISEEFDEIHDYQ
ncbi:MAG: DUF835 domain-containing protein [Thermoplasmata archaeon]